MVYKFYRKETGETEEVEKVRWIWRATLNTGETLSQYAPDGTFHQIREIDQEKLHTFTMIEDKTGREIQVLFPDGGKLIHYYLHTILAHGTTEEQRIMTFCFGYEHNGQKVIMAIFPDNTIGLVDDENKIKLQ